MAESKPTIDNLRVAADRRREAEIEYLTIENALLRDEVHQLREQLNPTKVRIGRPPGSGRKKS